MTGESVITIQDVETSAKDKTMNTHLSNTIPSKRADNPINWKLAVSFILVVVLMGLVPFAAAWRLDWWQAWVYSAIMIGTSFLSRYLVFRKNPGLIAERFRFTTTKGIEGWDKLLAPMVAIVGPLLTLIVAGLDKRNAWSPDVSLPLQVVAIVLLLLSGAFGTWAMLENPYFTSAVRIQNDRGQTAITSGPYRFIRHPAYAGSILWWLVTPVILGTLWGIIPAGIQILLFVIRTALEDKTLQEALGGYKEYTQQTRYRLLPGVW